MEASTAVSERFETTEAQTPEQPIETSESTPEPVSGVILLSTGQTRAVVDIAPVVEALTSDTPPVFITVTSQGERELNVRASEIVTYE